METTETGVVNYVRLLNNEMITSRGFDFQKINQFYFRKYFNFLDLKSYYMNVFNLKLFVMFLSVYYYYLYYYSKCNSLDFNNIVVDYVCIFTNTH